MRGSPMTRNATSSHPTTTRLHTSYVETIQTLRFGSSNHRTASEHLTDELHAFSAPRREDDAITRANCGRLAFAEAPS